MLHESVSLNSLRHCRSVLVLTLGKIWQQNAEDDGETDSGDTFDDEEPSPASNAVSAVQS